MIEEDPSNSDPLGEGPRPKVFVGLSEAGSLPEVVHGRMLCVVHGRMCYRRISTMRSGEWVCPDERHEKAIGDSFP